MIAKEEVNLCLKLGMQKEGDTVSEEPTGMEGAEAGEQTQLE